MADQIDDAAIRRQALEEAISEIERMPRRIERLGGQRFRYVQLSEAVTAIRALAAIAKAEGGR